MSSRSALPLHALVIAGSLVTASLPLSAQNPTSRTVVTSTSPAPVAVSTPRAGSVVIDGRLDEAAWAAARPITSFRQYQPSEGEPATMRTEVRILYDDGALYVGARMYDPLGPAGIRAPLARRDQLLAGSGSNGAFNSLTSDKFAIALDPYHNRLDEAWFELNPAGVRGEQFNGDASWDPVWEGATHVDSSGWTAEMRIPYSQLRFSRDSVQTWGLQLWRYADRINEQDMWSFWKRDASGGPAFFGQLEGLRIAAQPRQLELLPYVVSTGQFRYAAPDDPYHSKHEGKVSVGGDLKYLLTPNLTLDATVNPDFGQVEVDPASLNLSAFETFYEEKRPFFVAGKGAFDFGGTSCMFCSNTSGIDVFYSRRIGRPPQLNGYVGARAAQGGFADTPGDATILGAAKLTGRTKGGYTVGLLDAVTDRETARFMPSPGSPRQTQAVEPLSNYFVGRVKRDFNRGATTIGAIATSTVRRLGSDSVLGDRLRGTATAVGLDWDHTWHQRGYSWRGTLVGSDVEGSAPAIALAERSSAHYFQRPDRGAFEGGLFAAPYDTLATSMRGYGLYTRLAKETGSWLWETAQSWRSPGFEVNDLAYLNRADYRSMNANVSRQWTTPTRWYRNVTTIVGAEQEFNYDGLRTYEDVHAYYSIVLPSYWRIRTYAMHHATVDDDRLTRGGPVVKRDGYNHGYAQVSTDPRGRAVFNLSVEGSRGIDAPDRTLAIQPGVAFKPAASVFIQLAPRVTANETAAQYVTTVGDPTATAFGGSRYVFAFLKSRTVSVDTRVNWTLRPDVTLQLFAQPFLASGDYGRFREFASPRTIRTLEYGRGLGTIARDATTGAYRVDPDGAGAAAPFTFRDPNFSVRSLRGTAVLRWEYHPGSTLFFVWTQQRSGSEPLSDLDFAHNSTALFRDRPDNVFTVKATYWLGR